MTNEKSNNCWSKTFKCTFTMMAKAWANFAPKSYNDRLLISPVWMYELKRIQRTKKMYGLTNKKDVRTKKSTLNPVAGQLSWWSSFPNESSDCAISLFNAWIIRFFEKNQSKNHNFATVGNKIVIFWLIIIFQKSIKIFQISNLVKVRALPWSGVCPWMRSVLAIMPIRPDPHYLIQYYKINRKL